ncbi:expressed unknown protein [Seminavis robusta]|uniref:Uncharacterized protein n=1 Tax=Seminavis robusta TaxID=568900 RepID=A0A9N8ERW3_9STRA|nr:expressed unknown protein [Seminavis robusta]|eukprot:Sro1767_g296320.1 n/a (137) ;mRNA; r:19371-19781
MHHRSSREQGEKSQCKAGETVVENSCTVEAEDEAEFPPMPPINQTAAIPPASAAESDLGTLQEQLKTALSGRAEAEAELATTVIEWDELRLQADELLQSELDEINNDEQQQQLPGFASLKLRFQALHLPIQTETLP